MSTRKKKSVAPLRKQPSQARSRATVDTIVRVGARILSERGWADFTTNGVADAAGVSIGSLYQYFPNKLALVEAIRRLHFDEVLTVLRGIVGANKSAQRMVEELVDGMIAVHSIDPALHRVLLDEVPPYRDARSAHTAFQSEYDEIYQSIVAAHSARKNAASIEIKALVLSSATEGMIHGAARNGMLQSKAWRRELLAMLRAYLESC